MKEIILIGPSGSGKSTSCDILKKSLYENGYIVYVVPEMVGHVIDNIPFSLNFLRKKDLTQLILIQDMFVDLYKNYLKNIREIAKLNKKSVIIHDRGLIDYCYFNPINHYTGFRLEDFDEDYCDEISDWVKGFNDVTVIAIEKVFSDNEKDYESGKENNPHRYEKYNENYENYKNIYDIYGHWFQDMVDVKSSKNVYDIAINYLGEK